MARKLSVEYLETRRLLSRNSSNMDVDVDGSVTALDALYVAQAIRGEIQTVDTTAGATKSSGNRVHAVQERSLDFNENGNLEWGDVEELVYALICDSGAKEIVDIDGDGEMTVRDFDILADDIAESFRNEPAPPSVDALTEKTGNIGGGVGGNAQSANELLRELEAKEGFGVGANSSAANGSSSPTINLTIYRGQSGVYVADSIEDTTGSYTVANLNDTDADDITDNVDMWVSGDNVTGISEVDLMRVTVQKPTGFTGNNVLLTIQGPGKLCVSDKKGPCVNSISITPPAWGTAGYRNYWVEASNKSQSIGDIVVTATYTNENGTGTDVVVATGIWASIDYVSHDLRSWNDISTDRPNLALHPDPKPALIIAEYGGTGLRPINAENGVLNAILIQFKVEPAAAASVAGIRYDITRRQDKEIWEFYNGGVGWQQLLPESESMPSMQDKANDDLGVGDENDEPDSNGFIAVEDGPGLDHHIESHPDLVNKSGLWSFEEFVRVKLDGNDPSGNTLSGSRSSDKYEWNNRFFLHKGGGNVYVRVDGDPPPETVKNRIAPGKASTTGPIPQ